MTSLTNVPKTVIAANTPFELLDYCREQGILVEAYLPSDYGDASFFPVFDGKP